MPTRKPDPEAAAADPAAVDALPPLGDGVRSRLRRVTLAQQAFERSIQRTLAVDAMGLAAMDHLVTAGPTTPTELAGRLGISTAAMSLVLNRLEAAGHAHRERHPSDGRKLVVTAADRSSEAAHAAVLPVITGIEEVIASMGDADRATVQDFLDRLVAVYEDATPRHAPEAP
ncbi:MarR family transcriptional regulator [Clavibacter michiganensis subsp. phaseoli]|uniref:MarR family winged helix-turn-helix transcriptional regulator n=1 Tax=Clavibacter phaseoli TaxID=1734031 RepID=UPI000E67408B|nr:MarR family transcriptional regulator [Clavibacter phaseoli]MCJ1711594.1 MarR family transcriptional regulator [Clavibacter phaseoli]RII92936.1 MarR family transcriptional regulator [Clavibacter michiganensis]